MFLAPMLRRSGFAKVVRVIFDSPVGLARPGWPDLAGADPDTVQAHLAAALAALLPGDLAVAPMPEE